MYWKANSRFVGERLERVERNDPEMTAYAPSPHVGDIGAVRTSFLFFNPANAP